MVPRILRGSWRAGAGSQVDISLARCVPTALSPRARMCVRYALRYAGHYLLRSSAFADQLATCNTAGECFVKNDSPFPFDGTVHISLINLQNGRVAGISRHMVALVRGAGVTEWFCAVNGSVSGGCADWTRSDAWASTGCSHAACVLTVETTNSSGAQVSNNVLPFLPPHALALRQTFVTARVGAPNSNGSIPIRLSAAPAPALYVVLTTAAPGRFSENAFLLLSEAVVEFLPWAKVDAALLRSLNATLRVEHIAANL